MLPLVAVLLAVFMGFASIGIDIGFLEYKQQVQQSATDAAAIGAAESAYTNSCNNASAEKAAGQNDATLNGFTTGGNVTVSVTPDPTSGHFANNPCAMDVTITTKGVQTFFSQMFGFFGMSESTHAVGLASKSSSNGCVYLLSTGNSDTSNFSNTNFSAPGCAVYINSSGSSNMSNATLNFASLGYAGQAPNESGATFTSATPAPMKTVTDPCSTISGCAWLTNNATTIEAQSCSDMSYGNNSIVGSLTGGTTCFNKLQIHGSNVTVCGLIEVLGSTLQMDSSTITSCASGVTFFMGNQTNTVNFGGGANLTLSAMTSGNTAGVLFWRDPSQGNSVNYSSSTYSFSGLIYYPTSQVTYSAGSSGFTTLVFGYGNFSVSTGTTLASPPPNSSTGLPATLAE